MAILRTPENLNNSVQYVATLAFFCGVSCVALMLKFGGFKASLNLFNPKRHSKDNDEFEPGMCISGAYRTNRDEYFGNDSVYEPPKRLTPSMVKLPQCHETAPAIRPTKSSSDLPNVNNLPAHLRHSNPTVSLDPRGEGERFPRNSRNGTTNTVPNVNLEKEQAKARQIQLAEQKRREKAAAKEQAKQEKLAKAREKKEAKDKAKRDKQEKKVISPVAQPPQQSTSSVTATTITQQRSANPLSQITNYPTNTLDSSISRSSGPPPYTEVPNPAPKLGSASKQTTGDVIFSKPIDTGSWDMVLQHRQQVSRATNATAASNKQRVIDLNYNFNTDNTDA